MPNKIGTVNQIDNTRTVNTKFGPKTVFDIYLTDGMKLTSWKKPAITVGQTYEFDYVASSYGNDFKGATPTTGSPGFAGGVAPAAPAPAPAATPGAAAPASLPPAGGPRDPFNFQNGPRPFPLPLTHGDRSFVRKDSLALAIEAYRVAADNGDPSIKKGDLQAAQLLELARFFEGYLSGDRDVEMAEQIIADPAAATMANLAAKKAS